MTNQYGIEIPKGFRAAEGMAGSDAIKLSFPDEPEGEWPLQQKLKGFTSEVDSSQFDAAQKNPEPSLNDITKASTR